MELCPGCGESLAEIGWVRLGWFSKRCFKCYRRIKKICIIMIIILSIVLITLLSIIFSYHWNNI